MAVLLYLTVEDVTLCKSSLVLLPEMVVVWLVTFLIEGLREYSYKENTMKQFYKTVIKTTTIF